MHARRLWIAVTAVAALALGACSASDEPADGTDATQGAGGGPQDTLRIGIKFDQPGLGYQDGSKYTGFDVAVATYVAEKLGYTAEQIEWVQAPSAQRETMLQNGQVDMVFATYSITDKRKEVVAFAGPYFVAGQDLLVAADDDSITGPEDLEGKNLCSVTGSTSAQRIRDEHAATTNLLEQPGYAECVTALVAGTVDAVTTDDIILAGLAALPANEGKVKVVGNPFSQERYGVGLPQDNDVCEDVNAAITEMIEDGSWQAALDENVGASGYVPDAAANPPTVDACA